MNRERDAHRARVFGLCTCAVVVASVAAVGLQWWMGPIIVAVLTYLAFAGDH